MIFVDIARTRWGPMNLYQTFAQQFGLKIPSWSFIRQFHFFIARHLAGRNVTPADPAENVDSWCA